MGCIDTGPGAIGAAAGGSQPWQPLSPLTGSGNLHLLQADVTANDKLDQELMSELTVIGPSTTLIIGPEGQEYRARRTTGEVAAEQFMERLAAARQSYKEQQC